MRFPKAITVRDEDYLKFIRSKRCVVCGSDSPVPHHEPIRGTGIGMKGSDLETVPLCNRCHQHRHAYGVHTFWQHQDVKLIIIKLLSEYIEKQSITAD